MLTKVRKDHDICLIQQTVNDYIIYILQKPYTVRENHGPVL